MGYKNFKKNVVFLLQPSDYHGFQDSRYEENTIEELRSISGIKRNLGKNELNVELRTWTPWLLAGEISKSGSCSFCLSNG